MTVTHRIIVIGASAGGVSALMRLVPALPADFAAPILLVLHIGAHRSHLPELLTARGPLPAVFATDGMTPVPGTIHVAPADHHLMVHEGVLRLSRGPKEHHARPAIDPLFRSAALAYGPLAVGVVLSGLLDDGSAGLRAIKACGGTAVVQDPGDAEEPDMPRSALRAAAVDHVAGLAAMAGLLGDLARPLAEVAPFTAPEWLRVDHAVSLGRAGLEDLKNIGKASEFTCPDCGGTLFDLNDDGPAHLRCHTGHAFSLRSLAKTQGTVAEAVLWSAIRAMQEKESILRRLAVEQESDAMVAEADQLAGFTDRMRALVTDGPANVDV